MKRTNEESIQRLIALGLSAKEAGVYISILELGRGTVSEISLKANINRTTGYDILGSLMHQGLVRISGKEPKQEYVAESPDNLVALLEKRRRESDENIGAAKEFVPQLKSIHKTGNRPQIKFFEGTEGLRQVYEDTLTSKTKSIIAYTSLEDQHAGVPGYFPTYYKRRVANGISMRAIFPKTPMGIERASHDKEEMRESAFIPPDEFGFHPAINVYDDKVMIASIREKLGIIIESGEIADAMRKIFQLAWREAKRLDKQLSDDTN